MTNSNLLNGTDTLLLRIFTSILLRLVGLWLKRNNHQYE